MSVKERILAIRLMEKLQSHPDFAKRRDYHGRNLLWKDLCRMCTEGNTELLRL